MKIKIPSKTVDACDVCKRETICLTQCMICGRDYCHTCEAVIMACVHQPEVCKNCADSATVTGEKVRSIVFDFAKPLVYLLKKRHAALGRIPKPPHAKSR